MYRFYFMNNVYCTLSYKVGKIFRSAINKSICEKGGKYSRGIPRLVTIKHIPDSNDKLSCINVMALLRYLEKVLGRGFLSYLLEELSVLADSDDYGEEDEYYMNLVVEYLHMRV